MRNLSLVVLLPALLCSQKAFSQKRPVTHEDIWMMKRTGEPVVSPDGRSIVFSLTEPDYDPAKQVTASFENNGKSLIFSIADQGKGVDWENLPDPLAPENLLRGTGRGIFLIRSFMDEVHFRQLEPGTELTLIKHLVPAQETT